MDSSKEYFACLALRHTPRLGPKVWKGLFEHYPSAFDAVQNAGRWPELSLATRAMSKGCLLEKWRTRAEEEFREARRLNMKVLTWFDPRFPESFRQLPDPPSHIYVQGDLSLLRNPGVAVVGARECTKLGLETARRISGELSRIGITVISGLALGIDRQAHLGGLSGLGSSVAVLGCGLDIPYPAGNFDVREALEQKGLLITEFGPGVRARGGHFPVRNRLISALSLGVLVVEAAHRSGSLITARLAGEQGRDVFAVPGPIGQPTFTGCHRLIKQGAALVENAADIVEILRFDFARELAQVPDPESQSAPGDVTEDVDLCASATHISPPPKRSGERRKPTVGKRNSPVRRESLKLSGDETRVLDLLDGIDKIHIDALGRSLGWDSATVSRILLKLEMRGAVQQLPGMWYLAREE